MKGIKRYLLGRIGMSLLTYVEGQDTHGVVLLNLPAGAELVERALRHPREYIHLDSRQTSGYNLHFSRAYTLTLVIIRKYSSI